MRSKIAHTVSTLVTVHGVKKVGFTAYHLGMLLLVCTSSRVF